MTNDALRFPVEPMRVSDIDAAMEIEYASFTAPWSARSYASEIENNPNAYYFVVRAAPRVSASPGNSFLHRARGILARAPAKPATLVGYAGFWMLVDEAHIGTIATHPQWRRRGIGGLLLAAMIERAAALGAQMVTLEVRVSNGAAAALYRKFGFEIQGTRRHYYHDDGEDAHIMTKTGFVKSAGQAVGLRAHSTVLQSDSKEPTNG